ncbi:hypothetical protein SAMN04487928_108117 [Butyrivibrio proteoclasticus]|uniref:SH3 domain-containing protein n=1 Tax=Butyrivibrio proteoclasticus TaxID=43305 RepID=A0A1I5TDA2_9FIRM|nr:hypothetical protein [Butyrivibrio proteoclasticus]SFP80406.1 hypothetical protein SAMN04487928_108117 [Butyrivibrio proteoclasticus]
MDRSNSEKIKEVISKIRSKITDKGFRQRFIKRINPPPAEKADYLVEYFFRILLFLFPLFIYEQNAIIGISYKDILFCMFIIIMSLWCGIVLLRTDSIRRMFNKKTTMLFTGGFVLILVCFGKQLYSISSEVPHTFLYIGGYLLVFCASFSGKGSRYLLQLALASQVLVLISAYRYIITATSTLIGAEILLKNTDKLIPAIILECSISAFLYVIEEKEKNQKVYLAILTAGEVILFLYGNMVAFVILFFYILMLQFLRLPTADFMKKNMILLFLYGFAASNAPLLSYFNLPGLNKEFDLEYSIYIDIAIAVLGLVITSYWEHIPKNHDEKNTVLVIFSKWYKRGIIFAVVILMVCFVFGGRGDKLSNAIGGKALSGLSTSLWKSVSKTNGELWHVLKVYGLIGVFLMLIFGAVVLISLINMLKEENTSEIQKAYIYISILFLIQSFFFPFSSTSTPIYLIIMGLAIKEDMNETVVKKDIEYDSVTDCINLNDEFAYKKRELEKEKELQLIWIPQATAKILNQAHENITDEILFKKNAEVRKEKENTLARKFFSVLPFGVASALVAAFLVMLVFLLYRLFMPVGNSGEVESMVAVAKEHRDDMLLAQTISETDDGAISTEEISANAVESEGEGNIALSEADNKEATDNASKLKTNAGGENVENDTEKSELNDESEEKLEEAEKIDDSQIQPGISHGVYTIYDPNAAYSAVDEIVTGKNRVVNLRTKPSVTDDAEVIHALLEGEKVHRTAVGQNGWSKVEFGGRTLYAVSNFLEVVTEEVQSEENTEQENINENAEDELEAEEPIEEAPEATEESAKAEQAKNAAEKAKKPVSYSVQWSQDNKNCSIWSAGVLQGKMSVSDKDGKTLSITYYGTYYQGSGNNQKEYFYISVPVKDGSYTVNVDQGFVDAIKAMGYEGLYINKRIQNW